MTMLSRICWFDFLMMISLCLFPQTKASPVECSDCHPACARLDRRQDITSSLQQICKRCRPCNNEERAVAPACLALNCSQRCVSNDNGNENYFCACYSGYRLNDDMRTCTDIDECVEQNIHCPISTKNHYQGEAGNCENAPGYYVCTHCRQVGYTPYYSKQGCCKPSAGNSNCGRDVRVPFDFKTEQIENFSYKFPWLAFIRLDTKLCSGVLISEKWVLTAAQCLSDPYLYFDRMRVILGSYIAGVSNPYQAIIKVDNVLLQDEYQYHGHDIALLHLYTEAIPNPKIGFICLPNGEEPQEGDVCTSLGHRGFQTELVTIGVAEAMDVSIQSETSCQAALRHRTMHRNASLHICAGDLVGKEEDCRTSSGGPLVCQRSNSCEWYVAGVTSFITRCATAGLNKAYTKVAHYENWISNVAQVWANVSFLPEPEMESESESSYDILLTDLGL